MEDQEFLDAARKSPVMSHNDFPNLAELCTFINSTPPDDEQKYRNFRLDNQRERLKSLLEDVEETKMPEESKYYPVKEELMPVVIWLEKLSAEFEIIIKELAAINQILREVKSEAREL